MPDWEVDSCASTSNAILSAASDSALKLFEEWYNTCVLNFSASDFRVDPTDSACVDTDSCLCATYLPMAHITAKDVSRVSSISTRT